MGRDAAHGPFVNVEGSTPKPDNSAGQEAASNVCGVGAAMLPGQSWAPILADRHAVNVGTSRGRPFPGQPGRWGGQVRRRLMVSGGAEAP
jgi:hypothetical protein